MKICKKCNLNKNLDEYYNQPRNKDGKQGLCKVCMNERTRVWFKEHPEERRAKSRDNFHRRMSDPEFRKNHSNKTKFRKRPYLVHREDQCRRCGFTPEHSCQLTVDHIDKDRSNNSVDNLQTLCHNCHNLKNWIEVFEPENLEKLNLIPIKDSTSDSRDPK